MTLGDTILGTFPSLFLKKKNIVGRLGWFRGDGTHLEIGEEASGSQEEGTSFTHRTSPPPSSLCSNPSLPPPPPPIQQLLPLLSCYKSAPLPKQIWQFSPYFSVLHSLIQNPSTLYLIEIHNFCYRLSTYHYVPHKDY